MDETHVWRSVESLKALWTGLDMAKDARHLPTSEQIKSHWDSRSGLGATAGTQDLILKQLEQRAIESEVQTILRFGLTRILEVGCGTGDFSKCVASWRGVEEIYAIDTSAEMVAESLKTLPIGLPWSISQIDVRDIPRQWGTLGIVYSERCLINLPTWAEQKNAIDKIASMLSQGGRFIMCEHSQDGLDAINTERAKLNLSVIERPWHNKYFLDSELATITSLKLLECIPFSATYYFLSRVINAKLAAEEGREPEYDAPINRLALTLPADMVNPALAQGRLWIWAKE